MKRQRSRIVMVIPGIVIIIVVVGAGLGTWFFLSVFDSFDADEALAQQTFAEAPDAMPARDLQNVHALTRNPEEAEELEGYGPALFLDHLEEDGSRTLVWTD